MSIGIIKFTSSPTILDRRTFCCCKMVLCKTKDLVFHPRIPPLLEEVFGVDKNYDFSFKNGMLASIAGWKKGKLILGSMKAVALDSIRYIRKAWKLKEIEKIKREWIEITVLNLFPDFCKRDAHFPLREKNPLSLKTLIFVTATFPKGDTYWLLWDKLFYISLID